MLNQLVEHLEKSNRLFFNSTLLTKNEDFFKAETLKVITDNLLKNADREEGGFGAAPKFLQTGSIIYLIQYAHVSGQVEMADHAILSLQKMIRGGIYDQLGGGISRYSTDKQWLVPHFEKMLYDNALLVLSLCEAYAFSKNKEFEKAIHRTINFVANELKHPEGGFYTALDADSEGVEGKYYVWDKAEIESVLGKDAGLFCDYYGVSESGNWEHKNILNTRESLAEFSTRINLSPDAVETSLEESRLKLLAVRISRIAPALDDKILLNNNALFISALCKAYACTGDKSYREMAKEAFIFIENFLKNDEEQLIHNFKGGKKGVPAFLDDYAYYIQSLIHLQEVTGEQAYLVKARSYLGFVISNFSDESGLFFFYSNQAQGDVIVRKTELYDGAMPSSNAVMARVLGSLAVYFNESSWGERSRKMIANISTATEKYPGSFAYWAALYLGQVAGSSEIAIIGENSPSMLTEIISIYLPFTILQSSTGEDSTGFPLLEGRSQNGETNIYLCEQYACLAPVKTVYDLELLLKNRPGLETPPQ